MNGKENVPAGWQREASEISCHSVEELWCEEAEEREEREEDEKEEARQEAEKRELRPTVVGKEALVVAGIVLRGGKAEKGEKGRGLKASENLGE